MDVRDDDVRDEDDLRDEPEDGREEDEDRPPDDERDDRDDVCDDPVERDVLDEVVFDEDDDVFDSRPASPGNLNFRSPSSRFSTYVL